MEHEPDHPPVYHGGTRLTPSVVDLLCGLMARTLAAYNNLAGDIARGNLDDEYDSWIDFDIYESYSVVDVRTDRNAHLHHLPPGYRGLVACYDDRPFAAVSFLADGADLIGLACGRLVRLVPDHLPGERCWIPEPLDGPSDPPVEPVPALPLPRRRPVRL